MSDPSALEGRSRPTPRVALATLALAVGLGLLGDALLREGPWGVNFAAWAATLAAALACVLASRGAFSGANRLSVVLILSFALCFAWRASPALQFANMLAILAAVGMLTVSMGVPRLAEAGLMDYARGAISTLGRLAAGLPILATRAVSREVATLSVARTAARVGIGAVLALPVLAVFGALLAAADPVFENVVRSLVRWDIERLLSHLLLIAVVAWLVAGPLSGALAPRATARSPLSSSPRPFGLPELGPPLGALATLFVAFTGLQASYFFGGQSAMDRLGLTYAAYARRGFIELVTVAALLVPVLLAAEAMLDRRVTSAVTVIRWLMGVLLALIALIMLSAAWRLSLYIEAYGLTLDRLYAAAFMVWIAFVLTWFALTILRDRAPRFASGAVAGGFVLLGLLNVMNPERVIARANIAAYDRTGRLDASYLSRLGSDAAPAIAAVWADLPVEARCVITARADRRVSGWRVWTVSRWRAERVVRDWRTYREATTCPARQTEQH